MMNAQQLNPNVFEAVDIIKLAKQLTGYAMTWDLGDELQAAGLPFSVADPIDTKTIALMCDQTRAAFLAGYMIGRNPDLLILGSFGSIFVHDTQE